MVTIFRAPIVTRIALSAFVAAALCSMADVRQDTLLTTLAKPFNQTNWPVPKGPIYSTSNFTFVNTLNLNLLGKDKFYGLGGSPQFDWPVPKGPIFSGDSRTFTNRLATPSYTVPQSYTFRPPLITRYATEVINYRPDSNWPPNLLARELPASKPTFQLDWPNPRGYAFPTDLRTFVNNVEIQLIGKDLFFRGAGQGPSYDWPNPRGASFPIDSRTWISEPLDELFVAPTSYVTRPPLITRIEREPYAHDSSWPNLVGTTLSPAATQIPAGAHWIWSNPTYRQTWFDTTTIGGVLQGFETPIGVVEVQIPTLARYVPELRTWIVTLTQNTLAIPPGIPTRPILWQNPKLPGDVLALRTWVVDLLHSTIAPLPGPNIIPLSWPNPRGYVPSVSLKTFIDPLKIVLQGKDLFFGAAGQPPNYDWPNPTGLVVKRWNFAAVLPEQGGLAPEELAPVTYTSYGGPFLYTSSNWGYGSFYLEVYMRATVGTIIARLYNETASTEVVASTVTTNSATFTRIRSSGFTLTNGHTYRLQFGKSGLDSGETLSGRLIVY